MSIPSITNCKVADDPNTSHYLKGETMEKKKENIVCTVCREYGPGKLNDCHIDFMNCRVYDDLVNRLAERLKTDVRDQTQEDA